MQIGYIKECNCKPDFMHVDGNERQVACVDLNHYVSVCPEPPIPMILAHALHDGLSAVRYGKDAPVVSVTMLTRCPLTVYYETHYDWVAKVLDTRFMLRGTFAHEGMLSGMKDKPGWIVETPRGKVFDDGLCVYGTPDAYSQGSCMLYDLKTQNEYAITKKNGMTDAELLSDPWVRDNVAQVNGYAALLREAGLPVNRAELQYFDGKFRFRILEVPLAEHAQVLTWMESTGRKFQKILDNDIDVSTLTPKEYKGWKPSSGVDYLVKKELERRS